MRKLIPGSRVADLEREVEAARSTTADLEDALECERRDAAELAPKQQKASSAYVETCGAYETARDETTAPLLDAAAAIERLQTARRDMVEARRAAERIGADLPVVAPGKLQQTEEGRRAVEELRMKAVLSL